MNYKCEIIADSISLQGDRLTTYKVTYPRIIHAEMLRHRMLSRNVASSRAIPFKKMVKDVQENPFIPIAWQKDHKGMQGTEYHTEKGNIIFNISAWLVARDEAVRVAKNLAESDVTKQLCNRLLEPFVWTTELISGTEWENFFELRCPKYDWNGIIQKSKRDWITANDRAYDSKFELNVPNSDIDWLSINKSGAEIHIQKIAEMMWDAMNESTPKQLSSGEWHIPMGDRIDEHKTEQLTSFKDKKNIPMEDVDDFFNEMDSVKLKICTARAARISYETLGDNPKIDYEADIKLHDRLMEMKHWSPFEHCARAMSNAEYYSFIKGVVKTKVANSFGEIRSHTIDAKSNVFGWCNNFKGFIQYRHLVE